MWNSYHFFNYDFDKMNHCLRQAVMGLPAFFLEDMFFIRYWHGGPHMRFRVRQGQDTSILLSSLSDYWQREGNDSDLDVEEYYRPYRKYFSGEEGDILYPGGSIQSIAYEPELERYGGEAGIALCEQYFCQDSKRILRYLAEETPANENTMYLYCLAYARVADSFGLDGLSLLNINGISATPETQLVSNKVSSIFSQRKALYQRSYQNFYEQQVMNGHYAELDRQLSGLVAGLQQEQVTDIEVILHSLLHMSFNRAGVAPFKESTIRYFAYLSQLDFGEAHAVKAG